MERSERYNHSGFDQDKSHRREGHHSLSRRMFLVGGMAATAAVLRSDHAKKRSVVNPLPKRTSPEIKTEDPRVLLFRKANSTIQETVSRIEINPTVSRSKKAKEVLSQTPLPNDGEGVALYFARAGERDEMIAIPSVTEMRRYLYDPKIRQYRIFTEREVEGKRFYSISISDMTKDIGVASRLTVEETRDREKHPATTLAVKRARYDQGKGGYADYVTYTPAHKDLRTKEVIAHGKEYVSTVVDQAASLFDQTKIDKEVLALSIEVARRVAVIEHIDPYEFYKKRKEGEDVKPLYETSLAEYALNLGSAYNHLINGVGAGGMMQIIPKTYKDVRAEIIKRGWFKEDEIPHDINEGRKTPLISAVISVALSYLNYEHAKVKFKERVTSLPHDDKLLVLASMYNGSPNLLRQILGPGEGVVSKVLRPVKKLASKHKEKATQSSPSIRHKLLKNGKGNKLAGTDETENENYMHKFIMYSKFV